jgi:hypothetical protein
MNTVDKITKDTRQVVVNSINDVIAKNLMSSAGEMGLSTDQITHLLRVVEISIDEGFHRSISVYQNMIKRHLEP